MKAVGLIWISGLALTLNGCPPPPPPTTGGDGGPSSDCGNSRQDAGEECDKGGNDTTCDADCTKPVCGDGHVNNVAGEGCDDGNTDNDDGCDGSCALEVEWVDIPGDTYRMGCSSMNTYPFDSDEDCWADSREYPAHDVTIEAFQMMPKEITQAQYEVARGNNPSNRADCPTCPVEQINWQEAKDFCEALEARLPSEAEWEFAARGGSKTRYHCDETGNAACLDDIAWHSDNSDTGNGGETHPVGEKTVNDYGLYDMLGNVKEWTQDCWHEKYDDAPTDGSAWVEDDCTDRRMIRGGSWDADTKQSRVSYRGWADPAIGNLGIGARCAQ